MYTNREIKKEVNRLINNSENNSFDKKVMSLADIVVKEQKKFDFKKKYCQEAYDYMLKTLKFINFYFMYNSNGSYDTVINLDYDYDLKKRREVFLSYRDDKFQIFGKERLTEKELSIIEKDSKFYEDLTYFGATQNHEKEVAISTSGMFEVFLYNTYMCLSCKKYGNSNSWFRVNYFYDKDSLNNSEDVIEIDTNIFGLKRLLQKDDCENVIKLLENIYVYEEDLPSRLKEEIVIKRILKEK